MDEEKSREASQRKARSEAILKSEGLPINPGLPVIGLDEGAGPRPLEEICYRALSLLPVAGRGCGLEPDDEAAMIENHDLRRHFTPAERAYIADPEPAEQARVQFCWRFESAWVLLWALGYVEEGLAPPRAVCDVQRAYDTAFSRPGAAFVKEARPLPFSDVLDQADLAYRTHWAVRQLWLTGEGLPEGVNPSIVYERHYALTWLTEGGVAWDEVETDT